MFDDVFKFVQQRKPLIHAITNTVTINDCANIILACGASPTMAEAVEEVEEIVDLADALVLNIGNLNRELVEAMRKAGKRANQRGIPIVLDPVGAGASRFRMETVKCLLEEIRCSVIRGNVSEMKALAFGGATRGVDALQEDAVTEERLPEFIQFTQELSRRTGAVISMSGAIDIVADGEKAYVLKNGVEMMSRVTGTGCMLSALTGAYCGACLEQVLSAATAAVGVMGLSGELAGQKVRERGEGTGSFRVYLLDAVSQMNGQQLQGGIRIESY